MLKKRREISSVLRDGDKKDILYKGLAFLIFRLGGMLAGYVLVWCVARLFGASVNGLVSLSFMLFILVGIVGRLGLDINMVKFYADDKNLMSNQGLLYKLLLHAFAASTFFSFLVYLARDFIVFGLFDKPEFVPYFDLTVLAIPFWTLTLVCAGFLRARRKNNWYAFLNNPGRFIFTLLFFGFLYIFSESPIIIVQAHLYAVILLSIIALIRVIGIFKNFSLQQSFSTGKFIKDSFPMMLSSTILVLLGWLDTFVLGIYVSDSEIGVYNVALKIATITTFSLQAINSILAPKIASNYYDGNLLQTKKLIRFSTKLNFYLTLCAVAVILAFNQYVLGVFGNEFKSGYAILVILCCGQLINSLSGSVGTTLQMTGLQRVYQNVVLIALCLNVTLNFVLTPYYGGIGSALATVVSIATWNVLGAVYLKRKQGLVTYYKFWK